MCEGLGEWDLRGWGGERIMGARREGRLVSLLGGMVAWRGGGQGGGWALLGRLGGMRVGDKGGGLRRAWVYALLDVAVVGFVGT